MGRVKLPYTPGPWILESDGWNGQWVYGNDADWRGGKHRYIAEVSLDYEGAEANARLIASAPELLEAVEDLLELVREDDNEWESRRDEFETRIRKARHVIAKVREEE